MTTLRETPLVDGTNATAFTNSVHVSLLSVSFVMVPAPIIEDIALDAGNYSSVCAISPATGPFVEVPLNDASQTQDGLDAFEASGSEHILIP